MIEFSKLHYRDFIDDLDFYLSNNITAPNLAKELDLMGFESICAIDFYEDIFSTNNPSIRQLETERAKDDYVTGEYGAIALEINERYKKRTTITQGLRELFTIIDESDNFCLMSPISYAGKNRTLKNSRYMYALCIEIDYINAQGLELLFRSFEIKIRPNLRPTYIVCSGNGLHLYYKFKEPLPMFENKRIELSQYKKVMTANLWGDRIADPKERIQYESINQAFRIVGTRSKGTARAMAFKIGDEIIFDDIKERFNHKWDYVKPKRTPLVECEKKFPEWYQKRIINGEPRKSPRFKKHRAIYDKWKERITRDRGGAVVGTRYYCLEQLCACAVVCNISRDELVRDCYEILPIFEKMTKSDDNHFTEFDIKSALTTYDNPSDSTYCRKLWTITEKTGIKLERVRRNGLKQEKHLQIARAIRDIKSPNWRQGNGRPSKEKEVQEWQKLHPNGTKAECRRETGLDTKTIRKFWQKIHNI